MKRILTLLLTLVMILGLIPASSVSAAAAPTVTESASVADAAIVLKEDWYTMSDTYNRGEEEKWYQGFPGKGDRVSLPHASSASATSVWYYNKFTPDLNLTDGQRVIASFEGCQYYTKIWINGNYIGDHEGSYGKFSFDLTDFIREDEENMLVIMLFSPMSGSTVRGDDFNNLPMWLTPWQYIQTPVYLTVVPELAIADVFVDTKYENGDVDVQVIVDNPGTETVKVNIGAQISPNGQNLVLTQVSSQFDAVPGLSRHTVTMNLKDFHAWSPDDPYLYSTRVTVQADAAAFMDSTVVQVGFKDLRVDSEGYFMLNGERLFVKSLHTSPYCTNGQFNSTYVGADIERQLAQFDYYKACGFNMVRFLAGPALPEMLDYCDKIGLLVYQEIGFAWKGENDDAEELVRREVRQLVERDRNHASFAIVGLLNETYDNEVDYEALNNYHAALNSLDVFRAYDNDLLVFLSSGRWDYDSANASASNPGSLTWDAYLGDEGVKNEDGTYAGQTAVGDIHKYPRMPFNKDVRDIFMDYDMLRACFISESGAGSQANIISGVRIWQQESQGAFDTNRADIGINQIPTLYQLYDKYEMYKGYGTPELLLRDTQQLQSNLRGLLIDFIRSNARISGYSLTQGTDAGQRGEGVLEHTTDFKDGMFESLVDGWQDTRWCVNIDHYNVYNTQTLDVDVYLSDLGALDVKEYTARFTVSGSEGVVWEKEVPFTPQRTKTGNYVSAVQVLCENIPLSGLATGEYRFNADLVGTGVSRTRLFWVTDAKDLPKLSGTVYAVGFNEEALALMKNAGLDVQTFDVDHIVHGSTILLGGKNMKNRTLKAIYESVKDHGTTVVGINPAAFGDWGYANLPFGSAIYQVTCDNWLYHYDTMMFDTTLTNGLKDNCIADSVYYEDVYPATHFNIPVAAAEAFALNMFVGVTGGASAQDLWHGVTAGAYTHGEGTVIVHTFRIIDNVGMPVADRMMLNLIDYALNEC